MNWTFRILLILVVLLVLDFHYTDGGRGGGSRGGYRSSSSRTSRTSRTSSSRSTSRVRSYTGPTYRTGSWKTAAAVGVVFGLMSYKRRRMYYGHPNREPRICYNEKNLRNGTYGYFICPEDYQKEDYAHCCGSSDEQKCCTYTDKSAEGRIAGIVIGVIVACIIIGVIVYCVCVRRRRQQQQAKGGVIISDTKSTGINGSHIPEQQPLTGPGYMSNAGGPQIPMQTYNTQPGMMPPQAYDSNASGLPYSTNPGAPGVTPYPPPDVTPYPPPGGPEAYPPPGGPEPYPPAGMAPYQEAGVPPAPGYAAQPPYAAAPSPIGFTDGKYPLPAGDVSGPQPYPPEAPQGSYPGGYPPPTDGKYPLPAGDVSGPQPYPPEAPQGSYQGGFPPPTGVMPTAPPPSYSSTQ